MVTPTTTTSAITSTQRIIGQYQGKRPGPAFIAIGNMHGNEPAGHIALQRVMRQLEAQQPAIRGRFYALSGNVGALKAGVRFIDEDMNRVWKEENRPLLKRESLNGQHSHEEREMFALYQTLQMISKQHRQEQFVLDLHTTSAASPPFFIMGDTIRNRHFAELVPVPIVLGIEEQIEGTLSSFLNELGYVAINYEAGQHNDPRSIDNHESAIWLSLVSCGCLTEDQVPDYDRHFLRLQEATAGIPPIFESRFRYAIQSWEHFSMLPGFENFQSIRKGQHIANSDDRKVITPENGRIFMPLYQKQGNDGFFVIRTIRPMWLKLSVGARKLNIDKYLPWLPGIKRHPDRPDTLIVNMRVARFLSVEFFHLLGYRKVREFNKYLYVTRRKFDFKRPKR